MPDKHAEGQVPESKQNAAPKMADFSDAFYKTRETSGMTEQNRADVNRPLERGPTFQQDPRIHAMDGECVCGAKSCPQCGLSQICIQIPDNPENRSSNVKNVPRAAATAIIVNECRCEEFEAQIAWSRILALAAGSRRAETSETSAQCEASQSGGEAVTPKTSDHPTTERE